MRCHVGLSVYIYEGTEAAICVAADVIKVNQIVPKKIIINKLIL